MDECHRPKKRTSSLGFGSHWTVFGESHGSKSLRTMELGTLVHAKMDKFSEKLWMAFDPPAPFREYILLIFPEDISNFISNESGMIFFRSEMTSPPLWSFPENSPILVGTGVPYRKMWVILNFEQNVSSAPPEPSRLWVYISSSAAFAHFTSSCLRHLQVGIISAKVY